MFMFMFDKGLLKEPFKGKGIVIVIIIIIYLFESLFIYPCICPC